MSLVGKLTLGAFLLIVAYSIANVYFSAKYDYDEKKLRERIEILENENDELNSTLNNITGEYTPFYIKEKLELFDNSIVFVLEGYGNYYYTYDCAQKITNGSYSFWAYNKETAISKGYYRGTC